MSINIKKYTKEQMAGMVEAAQAANAELERQVAALGDRIDKQNDALSDYANKTLTKAAGEEENKTMPEMVDLPMRKGCRTFNYFEDDD